MNFITQKHVNPYKIRKVNGSETSAKGSGALEMVQKINTQKQKEIIKL